MKTSTTLTQIRAQAPKSDVAPATEPSSAPPTPAEAARDATAILISGRLPASGNQENSNGDSNSHF